MNIAPQPYTEIRISLHKTDDVSDPNCVCLKFTGDATDVGTALILAMLADPGFEEIIRASLRSMDIPGVREVPVTKRL